MIGTGNAAAGTGTATGIGNVANVDGRIGTGNGTANTTGVSRAGVNSGACRKWGESRHSWPERGDYNTRGDWGRQGSWGTYGNRPEFERENEWRSGQAGSEWGQGTSGEWEPGRRESFGRYGGGLGGYGGFGSYGGGMGTYAQRGQFAGRGPKNWQRSDERIKDDVSERLSDHPDIDASEIEVMVKSAEVTLSGTVDHRGAKRLAEDIAQNVSGVKDVHNQIRVEKSYMREPGGTGATSSGIGSSTKNR